MINDEKLRAILSAQKMDPQGPEMRALQRVRGEVETLLRSVFADCSPIRYGGSKAMGTMLLDEFDLDLICYFPRSRKDD
jgi:tRNA nucleotidyltransferase (CCA-adding enzyme)